MQNSQSMSKGLFCFEIEICISKEQRPEQIKIKLLPVVFTQ